LISHKENLLVIIVEGKNEYIRSLCCGSSNFNNIYWFCLFCC